MKNFSPSSGFALLYAVLLTGIILAIGLGLSSIIAKQIVLSSTGAGSQKAYYAANAGKECVLHWGIYGGQDPDGNFLTAFGGYFLGEDGFEYYEGDAGLLNSIVCAGQEVTIPPPIRGDGSVYFNLGKFASGPADNQACATAEVILRAPDSPGGPSSEVIATGYNVACDEAGHPRQVERQIIGRGNFAAPF